MKIVFNVVKESIFIIIIACLIGVLTNTNLIKRYLKGEFHTGFLTIEKEFYPPEITIYEAEEYFIKGTALFIDSRTEEKFKEGHIPGAINIPVNSINSPEDLNKIDLPVDKILITYCEGGDCRSSFYLAYFLLKAGYKDVKVMAGGWPEWVQAGFPQE